MRLIKESIKKNQVYQVNYLLQIKVQNQLLLIIYKCILLTIRKNKAIF